MEMASRENCCGDGKPRELLSGKPIELLSDKPIELLSDKPIDLLSGKPRELLIVFKVDCVTTIVSV